MTNIVLVVFPGHVLHLQTIDLEKDSFV